MTESSIVLVIYPETLRNSENIQTFRQKPDFTSLAGEANSMEPKNWHTLHHMERSSSHVRSPSPVYYVDLTVDSPSDHRNRTILRRPTVVRLSESSGEAASSQITSQVPNEELIDCTNRLLPPKKRSRMDKGAKINTVIDLEDSAPPDEAARINDSASGETNVLSCPICFEYLTSKRKPTSTRCGHVYCSECIQQTLAMSKKCPKCQANITQKSCIRLYF